MQRLVIFLVLIVRGLIDPTITTCLSMNDNTKTPATLAFGIRVRQLRKARGLSQEALADLSELDRSYIGGIERGERNISLNNIHKISLALDVELVELFKDWDE